MAEEADNNHHNTNNNNNNNNNSSNNNSSKAPRLPRWTRQEIVVLIEAKRVAESRLRRGGRVLGAGLEPKWATVSSYCRTHGVNRGPVQCRKRWSNLAGDYKKIKDWEDSKAAQEESFWVMRNDLRREKRLPGFFDKEVYDILDTPQAKTQDEEHDEPDAANDTSVGLVLALGRCSTTTKEEGDDVAATAEEGEDEEVFFDSGRSAAAEEGLFSDSEEQPSSVAKERTNIPSPVPISEHQYSPSTKGPTSQGTHAEKQDGFFNPEVGDTSGGWRKRKRPSSPDRNDDKETIDLQHQLISVLEKNGQMLNTHLQSQNTNSQMDREQRKDHVDSLVAVLGKLADALGRIADKL